MQDALLQIKEKFNVSESELKKALKEAWRQPVMTRKDIQEAIATEMKKIVALHDKTPLVTLKKELIKAWEAAHPDGIERPSRKPSGWHIFMKEHGPSVQQEFPNSTQRERIKILGVRYNNAKAQQSVAPVPAVVEPQHAPVAQPRGKRRGAVVSAGDSV